jgi:hypothetical protein
MPDPTALDPLLVARAAAVIGSCMPDDGVARNAAHLWLGDTAAPRTYFRFATQLACFANANCGCEAIEQCGGWIYAPPPTACPSGCDGEIWTGCGDEVKVSIDCARLGLSCDADANCVAEPAQACDGSEPETCSADGEVQFCDDGAIRKSPCESLGHSCVDGKCVGTGPACDFGFSAESEIASPEPTGCDGDVLIGCLEQKEARIDCTKRGPGFSCQNVDEKFFCGLAAECLPADTYSETEVATCDGTVLSFCNAGRVERLDCTELGFSGCEIDRSIGHYGCTPALALETE